MPQKNLVSAKYVRDYLQHLQAVLRTLDPGQISRAGALLSSARRQGQQVFVCGNGGSAALASHLAVDLGKGASLNRPKRFRVLSLTDNVPWLTALANDLAYDRVFVEQLANYAVKGDLLVAISSSGNSPNVLKAVQYAARKGCRSIGISGFKGGRLKDLVDAHVLVDAAHMGRIEDGQLIVAHILCYAFMDAESTE